jgi:hypothetical protein
VNGALGLLVALLGGCRGGASLSLGPSALAVDREEKSGAQPLTPSTQSVNRYHSILSRFGAISLRLEHGRLAARFEEKGRPADLLAIENIDPRFLVPLLPYRHARRLDAFDRANLMLAEYSRNGVELSLQRHNTVYGFFRADGLFYEDEEYGFVDG